MDSAVKHCTAGIGIWEWASNDRGGEPDVVMACAGTCRPWRPWRPVDLLRKQLPDLKVRVVNVVDLMKLQPASEHPHGLDDNDFDALFTTRQAGHLRLPRLPLADPPADLPPDQPQEHPRPRLQGGGHDHHALRHDGAQRPRPLPPRRGRHRPRAAPRPRRRLREAVVRDKLIEHRQYVRDARRGHARGPRLEVGPLGITMAITSRSHPRLRRS